MVRDVKNLLVTVIINVFISISVFMILQNTLYKPKQIAVIDLQDIVSNHIRTMTNNNNNNNDNKINNEGNNIIELDAFMNRLNNLLQQVSSQNNIILLPKQAILGGEDMDITEQFKGAIGQ
jgi:hypothetical protein